MSTLEPIDPDLRAFLAPAEVIPEVSDGFRSRVFSRVRSWVSASSVALSERPSFWVRTGTIAGVFVAGGIVGALLGVWVLRDLVAATPPADRVERPGAFAHHEPEPDPVIDPAPTSPVAPIAAHPSSTHTRRLTPSSPATTAIDEYLTQERRLIDAARAALMADLPREALQSCERHARGFPSGQLAEERELLRAQALSRIRAARPKNTQ